MDDSPLFDFTANLGDSSKTLHNLLGVHVRRRSDVDILITANKMSDKANI